MSTQTVKGAPLGVPGNDDPYAGEILVRRTFTVHSALATMLLAAVAVAAVYYLNPLYAGAVLFGISFLYLTRKLVFNWTGAFIVLLAVIMFIPVRYYALPIPIGFALEPYRLVIVLMVVAAIVALLIDPTFVWRPAAFGWPLGIWVATSLLSIAANVGYISEGGLGSGVAGAVISDLLMLSVFFVARLVLRNERLIEAALAFLVWSAVVVAFFAVIERATHQNVFTMLDKFLPLERLGGDQSAYRAGGYRSFGSSQHPIALAVMFTMMIPVAVYLSKWARWPFNEINRRIVYYGAILALLLGVVTAVSRTAIVTLGVMFLVTLLFRPKVGGWLILGMIPVLGLGFLLVPKILTDMIGSFLDPDALIASQYTSAGMAGAGRLADLEPAMAIVREHPFFGTGVGSRIVVGVDRNAFILDNQWLGTLMDAGAVGVIGLTVLFLVPIVMLLRYSFKRTSTPQYASLAFALAVLLVGYTIAAYFYDAFGFYQAFMLFWIFLAVGAWVLTEAPRKATRRRLAPEDAGHVSAFTRGGPHLPTGPAIGAHRSDHVVRKPAPLES
ncbi:MULTISPECIES: O-antigen ligase family protein [unclassified Rathayibacter]|uniref:O-antigen ligase family protein n=1 Tax=unclassified Rathayibacter TaxID=2609250 RepID=UPI00188B826A|nr:MULTISPECIES: O-antigen ligase family protein [unclassified Rathayibacter]MBF4461274.1 O-antigen ligase family protein [Rathayibacter sp. VKM Ac-2879]MBF4502685.1 O-antigen ligase family protein [Rathayibacter sp. VKM Ac-2878]